ncbi:hypothetical protein [Poseidonocella sp. HB161398]|uniref:hypothetical protein n=1 Tax=Poseidonocella sp. HB161398 TaxID=2320855 RepID=UPI00110848E6|nr:hypothetical protein [Poseidonocella sp. HB161398]
MTGQLRLGVSAIAAYSGLIGRIADEMRRARPGIDLEPAECHPGQFADLLQGGIDTGIGVPCRQELPPEPASALLEPHAPFIDLPASSPPRPRRSSRRRCRTWPSSAIPARATATGRGWPRMCSATTRARPAGSATRPWQPS